MNKKAGVILDKIIFDYYPALVDFEGKMKIKL